MAKQSPVQYGDGADHLLDLWRVSRTALMNNRYESVNVYAIGLTRVQIVALRPIANA